VNPLAPVTGKNHAHVIDSSGLENAGQNRLRLSIGIERIEIQVPEEPAQALGQSVLRHFERIAHVEVECCVAPRIPQSAASFPSWLAPPWLTRDACRDSLRVPMEERLICGRYRLIRVLGKGGMGDVWLAEDGAPGAFVALKLIHSQLAKDDEVRGRFAREARVAARLKSPHVAQLLAYGETEDGIPYIAMERLVGETLRDRLAARGRIPLPEMASILAHVCRGVANAHEHRLVHRDLKPENIFLSHEGNNEVTKVLDFGVAKSIDALSMANFDPTTTGALIGTPVYMSPEQAQGLKTIDMRSDLWSLGVVVFECITGALPFRAAALTQLIGKISVGPIPVPSQVAPEAGIPPAVDAWMARAMSRPAGQRFGSIEELSAAFLAAVGVVDSFQPTTWRGGFGAGARPEAAVSPASLGFSATLVMSPSAHMRLEQRSATADGGVDSLEVARAVPPVVAAFGEVNETLVSGPPPPRSNLWVVLVGVALVIVVAAVGMWLLR
jgi:eukaryotic-like serine/threonine-protein kinase